MTKAVNAIALTLIMTITTIAGCLDAGTDVGSRLNELGIESLPEESIGINTPVIDGVLDRPFLGIGTDEWQDSYTFPANEVGFVGSHNGKIDQDFVGLHIKALGDDVAVALEVPLNAEFNATVDSVSTTFYYSDGAGLVNSYRSASVGTATSPWSVEVISPCTFSTCVANEELSLIQREAFESEIMYRENETSTVTPTNYFDIMGPVMIQMEHLLAAKQSTTMLTLETMRWDALKYSRNLAGVDIRITFEDGDVIEIGQGSVLDDIYFGYVNPSSMESDLIIEGIEVVQVIQTEDMDMPLLKNKPTLARVYVTDTIPNGVDVELRICLVIICSAPLVDTLDAPEFVDRENFSASANFLIPQVWLQFDNLMLIADAKIPYISEYSDTDTSNNRHVEIFELTETTELNAGYIRLGEYSASSEVLDQLDEARAIKTMTYSLDLFPINDYDITPWAWPLSDEEIYNASSTTNSQIRDQLSVDFDSYRVQLAVETLLSNCYPGCTLPIIPDQLVALWPEFFGATGGGISDPGWLGGSSFVSTCSYGSSSAVHCPAHEMNHNLGPHNDYGPEYGEWGEHLSKTGDSDTDDCSTGGQDAVWNSIYGNTGKPFTINGLGWNVNDQNPADDQSALIPSSYPDVMTYCRATISSNPGVWYPVPYLADDPEIYKWMSTYRYELLYDYLGSHETWFPLEQYGRSVINQDDHIIRIVNLELNEDYEILEFNSEITTGIMDKNFGTDATDMKGQLTIVAVNGDGDVVGQRPVYPNFINSHGEPAETTSSVVRFQDNGEIVEVYLLDESGDIIDGIGTSMDLSAYSQQKVSLNQEVFQREDIFKPQWPKANFENAMFKIEYSKGDGIWYALSPWIDENTYAISVGNVPSSESAKIRIQVNNGFDSAFMYSDKFEVVNQAPELDVLIRAGQKTINSALPNPQFINTSYDYDEKSAGEALSRAMEMPEIVIQRHGSISITPKVVDLDWEDTNDAGCEVSLEYNGRLVWSTNQRAKIDSNDDIIRATHTLTDIMSAEAEKPCSSSGGKFAPISFPNSQFPAHMMLPGEYSLKVEYEDRSGAKADPVVIDFKIESEDMYSESDLLNFIENLIIVHPSFLDVETQRLCEIWNSGDIAREAENISDDDLAKIMELDMLSMCDGKDVKLQSLRSNDYSSRDK